MGWNHRYKAFFCFFFLKKRKENYFLFFYIRGTKVVFLCFFIGIDSSSSCLEVIFELSPR